MSSQSRSSVRAAGRKLGLAIAIVVVALGLITAATVFGKSGSSMLKENPAWRFAPHMPHRRSYTASAELRGKIYVSGGMVGNTGRPLNIFESFDPKTGKWDTNLPFQPRPFSAAAATGLRGKLYVVGGNGDADDRSIDGRQVYAYDVVRRRWASLAPLPQPRTNLAVVALQNKVYAIGGLDPVHATKTVFVYDPVHDDWTGGPPIPERLHALTALVFKGDIWVIGGQDAAGHAVRDVWIYTPYLHKWRKGPTMPLPMETAGAAVWGNEIHVVLEKKYLIYDEDTQKWRRGPGLETPRHALAVFAIDGTLYAMGGCIAPILEDSNIVETLDLAF